MIEQGASACVSRGRRLRRRTGDRDRVRLERHAAGHEADEDAVRVSSSAPLPHALLARPPRIVQRVYLDARHVAALPREPGVADARVERAEQVVEHERRERGDRPRPALRSVDVGEDEEADVADGVREVEGLVDAFANEAEAHQHRQSAA